MKRLLAPLSALVVILACSSAVESAPAVEEVAAPAQDELIASAMSAGPESIAADATIMDWELNVVREGTNDWTCLPDRPDTEGNDPWCVNGPWLNFLQAYVTQTEPSYTEFGIAYMLMGDSPVSNTDPYATGPTDDNEWVTGVNAHLMLLVPDLGLLENMSTDHQNGGPWVMWPDTPYAHIMVPIDAR